MAKRYTSMASRQSSGSSVVLMTCVAILLSGCATSQVPTPGTPSAADDGSLADQGSIVPPVVPDTMPDETVADVARERGLDPDSIIERKHEAEERVDELDEEAQAEFLQLFGPDPLGLATFPENADDYEIPLETNEQVERWVAYFANRVPDRFRLYLSRLGSWEGMIRQKLRLAGLPQDLLYLALIESGMNPNAYSRARAVGMWQFISSTGRRYGLEVSFWLDERRDPFKATDAAIAFLSDLYDEFGSWYLAAAAYNGGPGRVRRGIARTGSEDFWDLAEARTLRRETRNYVPKLIAAALIARNPERYGFSRIDEEVPWKFELVEVPDATSFDVLAEAAGTDEDMIRKLNPQYPRRVTPPKRTVELRVPAGTGEQFAANYANIPPEDRVTWLMHTVTRGQTLGHIAGRYGTSVAAIRAANGNVNPRRLQIGQRLIIPRSAGAVASRSVSSGTQVASQPSGPRTITVRRGDTLWSIARRHGVSTRELMSWNNLRSSVIHPGDRLRILN
jgi:membrane-bound lytic murein transglycosylase D